MSLARFQEKAAREYGFAFLTVGAAVLARFAVDPVTHDKGSFLFFAFAVMAAALYGGLRAGVAATILSLIIGDYLFIEPRYTFFTHDALADSILLALFTGLGVALSIIVEHLNRADARARKSREELAQANAVLEQHKRELETANERFRMAAEAANEAIWELNVGMNTASWTDLYTKSFGRRPADSSGEWWSEHVHPDDRERARSSFLGALNGTAASWACEYRMLRSDGSWAQVYDRASIARSPDGKPVRAIGAILDITEMKRAQEELQQRTEELARSNEDLQRFAFAVSHDLQAPLRMIGEYGRRLAAADLSKELLQRPVRGILDGVSHMTGIIQDLLEFARISSQPGMPETCTDSNVILGLALQHLQAGIQERGARIGADRLPRIMVNETALLRVFQNLIGNALKYCERTPEIHVGARRDEDMCIFSVTDNGIGIAPEYHERIFGIFQRLHGRDRYPGTGIGLASVKRIIESHGGRVWVESELGRGSTFYFSLQAADHAADASVR